jgi:hypothetical protein
MKRAVVAVGEGAPLGDAERVSVAMGPPRWAVRVTVAIGRASHARQVHASKVALERTFVFDTSAHLPFPPAVTRRCLLAAIGMTVLGREQSPIRMC